MTRTNLRRPSRATVDAAARTVVTAAIRLLERQAAGVPAERWNALDRRMAAALGAGRVPAAPVTEVVGRYQRLPADRRRALFDRSMVDLPVTAAIDVDRIRDLADALGPIELPDPADPRPFEVTFSHLVCDVQTSVVGSDEPFVVFGIVVPGELGLPPTTRTVTTPIYDEVDPGERRPPSGSQNLRLFGETGVALIDPDRPLMITANLFEHQPGGGAQATAMVVGLALVAVGVVLAEIPPLSGALILAGALTTILAPSFFGDKPVGDTRQVTLSAAAAAEFTSDDTLVTLPVIPFGVPDAPRYRAFLQLLRA